MIALPRIENAPAVAAAELDRSARVERTEALVLVRVVAAVVVSVAGPQSRDALAVGAVELVALARQILGDAHAVVVDQFAVLVAFALGRPVGRRVARLGAAAVVERARIELATLAVGREDLQVARRVVQSADQLDHVGTRVLLGAVESAQLQVGPVDEITKDGDGERVDGGRDEDLAVGSVQIGSLDLFAHCVRPVEHVVVVVDGQSAGLRQFLTDDGLL